MVSEQWLGNGLGAKAELLDTCNELAGVRPRLLYRGGEHCASPCRDTAEEALDQLGLCGTSGRAIGKSCEQGLRAIDLRRGSEQLGAGALTEPTAECCFRYRQRFA